MFSLIKSPKLAQLCLKTNVAALTAVRSHWNKDFKPAPYPKTQAEREAAAKKYGVHPSEYEPYPDDGHGFGDYPKLPLVSADSKDPNYPYDHPELKRNFGEPMHVDFDLVREDRFDVNLKTRLPGWVMCAQFLGALAGFFALYYCLENYKCFHQQMPRQYPGKGKTHYTFEPAD